MNIYDEKIKGWIECCIDRLNLNLRSLRVFTEAANSYYAYMPMIAALAGAKKIYAIAKDSIYGQGDVVGKELLATARRLKVEKKIEIVFSKEAKIISGVDIVLNTGFVRPINRTTINSLGPNAVISCPYEKWELRDGDIDLDACRAKGIWVNSLNESWHGFRIFDYVGMLAMKLLLEMGIEVFGTRVVVVSSDKFGTTIRKHLKANGADIELVKSLKIGKPSIERCEALVVADFTRTDSIIGPKGDISARQIFRINPNTKVMILCGSCDLRDAALTCYPVNRSYAKRMTKGFEHLGYKPLTMLQTATLKAGEISWKCKNLGHSLKRDKYRGLISYIYKH